MALPAPNPRPANGRSHLWVTFTRGARTVGQVASSDGTVRWGPSLGIEFSYPVPGVGEREELFRSSRRGVELCLRNGMQGVLRTGSSRLPLEELEAWGLTRQSRKGLWVPLTPEMSGRIAYRELVLTFQFGPAPEGAAKPRPTRIPLRFRKGFLAREEWPFALLSWAVYGVLFYLALYLAGLSLPEVRRPEAVPQRFAKLIYEAPQAPTRARSEILQRQQDAEEPEPQPPEEPSEPEVKPAPEKPPEPVAEEVPPVHAVAETPPPETRPSPEPAVSPPARVPVPAGPTREEIRQKMAKRGLLGILGGRGAVSTARSRASVLEGGGAAGDLDRVLENVEGLRAAPIGGESTGGGPGLSAGVDDEARRVSSARGTAVPLERREEQAIQAPPDEALDELSMKDVRAAIHKTVGTYLGGLRYLYNRELRKNPELEGKLTVSLEISPEGGVLDCTIVESTLGAPDFEQAVLSRIRKWRFPPVAEKTITVTYPFVFFPSM